MNNWIYPEEGLAICLETGEVFYNSALNPLMTNERAAEISEQLLGCRASNAVQKEVK